MKYRKLHTEEIKILTDRSCRCEDWDKVRVNWPASGGGDAERICNVEFSGQVKLGRMQKSFTLDDGVELRSGICDARLHNVEVGDNCVIRRVGEYIANYKIGNECIITDVGVITVRGRSRFGNGVNVAVLNETGGREVFITDRLSSHTAYVMALYRHRPQLHKRLCDIAETYADKYASAVGSIGDRVVIRRCNSIIDVRIGANCTILGSCRLVNGSINSTPEAPVLLGSGVVCEEFVISSGASVESNAMITRCFVGQACHLVHGYSATDSLFFANCYGGNGEACSIFAGPFTVTHHKSTLLISGMFSFMNAGSGSNQSNHMYKLGPIHQGILERGAKTSSDSYILWPSKVGAFSLVMGRHITHSDTSNLPFSYLIEQNNTTYLAPGVNLRSVGTIRDAQKWPKRDGRTDSEHLEHINYNLLSPYTIQKMFKGLKTLRNLLYSSGELSDVYSFHSTKITNKALRKGIKLYEMGIVKFLGNALISRLQVGGVIPPLNKFARTTMKAPAGMVVEQGDKPVSEQVMNERIRKALRLYAFNGVGDWADISGLLAPKNEVNALLDRIESGKVNKLREINAEFKRMYENYYNWEWEWAFAKFEEFFDVKISEITVNKVIEIIERWKAAVVELDRMLYEDARKEFSLASMTGFGADGTRKEKELDFEEVRGLFESNPFVQEILTHIDKKTKLGNNVIAALKKYERHGNSGAHGSSRANHRRG